MANLLDQREREVIKDLLSWDASRRRFERQFCTALLILGGGVIVWAAAFTLLNRDDRTIYDVVVPGFALGLLFVTIYIFGEKRIRERHRISGIVRKLAGEM